MELEEYTQYHETTLHKSPAFAYNTYLCTIPLDFPRVELHWHEQMEVIYVKKGEGTVTVGSHPYRVGAGTIVPVMPGELHSIEGLPETRMEYENIIFSLSILDSTEQSDWCRAHVVLPLQSGAFSCVCPIYPGTPLHQEASAALDEADQACAGKSDGYFLLVKSSLFRFLFALYTHRMETAKTPSSLHEDVLKQTILYVREHFAQPITIADAALVSGYSSAHFMRLFRQETGQTFVSYLTNYRLDYACYLLKESSVSVSQVAQLCGFDNFSYFIRLFRRRYGLPPGLFRREKRREMRRDAASPHP